MARAVMLSATAVVMMLVAGFAAPAAAQSNTTTPPPTTAAPPPAATGVDSCGSLAPNVTMCNVHPQSVAFRPAGVPVTGAPTYRTLHPDVTALSVGGVATAWQSEHQDGSFEGIYRQTATSSSTTQNPGSAVSRVPSAATGAQSNPSIAHISAGDEYVVVWDGPGDGASEGVYAKRFRMGSGLALSSNDAPVNTYTANAQTEPVVAATDTSGGFVVAWTSQYQDGSQTGVYAQLLASGTSGSISKIGSERQLNTFTSGFQHRASVATLNTSSAVDPRVVFVWESEGRDGSSTGIAGRVFSASATGLVPRTDEFLVNQFVAGAQRRPRVAATPDGGFLVTWETEDPSAPGSIALRAFDANYAASTNELGAVSSTSAARPSVAPMAEGGALVVFQMTPDARTDTAKVYAVAFNRSWALVVGPVPAVTAQAGMSQLEPAIAPSSPRTSSAVTADGTILVTWHTLHSVSEVASSDDPLLTPGVFVQKVRFGRPRQPTCPADSGVSHYDAPVSGACGPLSECKEQLCRCVTGSVPRSFNGTSCLANGGASLPRLSCAAQESCMRGYATCVESAASTVGGPLASVSSECRTWGRLFREAAQAASASATAYGSSALRASCDATMCGFYALTPSRCEYNLEATAQLLCQSPGAIQAATTNPPTTRSSGGGPGAPGPGSPGGPSAPGSTRSSSAPPRHTAAHTLHAFILLSTALVGAMSFSL